MTPLRDEIERAVAELSAAGVASPRPDALALAAHALGVRRLLLAVPPPLPDGFAVAYRDLVARRAAREPLQHIVGQAAFRHVTLRVQAGVFVPRPETEVVAGAAIDEARRVLAARPPLVVDLCTGTGAIAASVGAEVPGTRVIAVDASPDSVRLARTNLAGCGGPDTRVVAGDVADPALLADLAGAADVVVANPPYVRHDEALEPEVRDHDPALALYGGGADGLAVPALVVAAAARLLRPGGLFVMEHGDEQGSSVRALVAATATFDTIETHRDLAGRDRFVTARRVAR